MKAVFTVAPDRKGSLELMFTSRVSYKLHMYSNNVEQRKKKV